ncbi:hypothetical protein ACXX9E_29345 [Pseudomonas sp. GNP014]
MDFNLITLHDVHNNNDIAIEECEWSIVSNGENDPAVRYIKLVPTEKIKEE